MCVLRVVTVSDAKKRHNQTRECVKMDMRTSTESRAEGILHQIDFRAINDRQIAEQIRARSAEFREFIKSLKENNTLPTVILNLYTRFANIIKTEQEWLTSTIATENDGNRKSTLGRFQRLLNLQLTHLTHNRDHSLGLEIEQITIEEPQTRQPVTSTPDAAAIALKKQQTIEQAALTLTQHDSATIKAGYEEKIKRPIENVIAELRTETDPDKREALHAHRMNLVRFHIQAQAKILLNTATGLGWEKYDDLIAKPLAAINKQIELEKELWVGTNQEFNTKFAHLLQHQSRMTKIDEAYKTHHQRETKTVEEWCREEGCNQSEIDFTQQWIDKTIQDETIALERITDPNDAKLEDTSGLIEYIQTEINRCNQKNIPTGHLEQGVKSLEEILQTTQQRLESATVPQDAPSLAPQQDQPKKSWNLRATFSEAVGKAKDFLLGSTTRALATASVVLFTTIGLSATFSKSINGTGTPETYDSHPVNLSGKLLKIGEPSPQ